MNTWVMAFKVAGVGLSAVFMGLLMLTGGIKIMSYVCRLLVRKEKKESSIDSAV
ncbi:MAG: hypothetical protein C4576_07450 [Desulfobacteraceae bacterium]|nr:MAG: hypothetical protein C4576_07450 [Desulfobacteraceae bacterium]